jgi:hypothetical protein
MAISRLVICTIRLLPEPDKSVAMLLRGRRRHVTFGMDPGADPCPSNFLLLTAGPTTAAPDLGPRPDGVISTGGHKVALYGDGTSTALRTLSLT